MSAESLQAQRRGVPAGGMGWPLDRQELQPRRSFRNSANTSGSRQTQLHYSVLAVRPALLRERERAGPSAPKQLKSQVKQQQLLRGQRLEIAEC